MSSDLHGEVQLREAYEEDPWDPRSGAGEATETSSFWTAVTSVSNIVLLALD